MSATSELLSRFSGVTMVTDRLTMVTDRMAQVGEREGNLKTI